MDGKLHDLEDIHRSIFRFLGSLNRDTWRKMRRLVGVDPFQSKCNTAQFLGLWAYAAMRRDNPTKRVDSSDIRRFIAENGTDPSAYLTGLSQPDINPVPADGCDGIDLAAVIRDCFNLRIPESTLDRYCRHLFGQGYSVFQWYSKEQIEQLAHRRAELSAENKRRLIRCGYNLAQYNANRKSKQAS